MYTKIKRLCSRNREMLTIIIIVVVVEITNNILVLIVTRPTLAF